LFGDKRWWLDDTVRGLNEQQPDLKPKTNIGKIGVLIIGGLGISRQITSPGIGISEWNSLLSFAFGYYFRYIGHVFVLLHSFPSTRRETVPPPRV
jgi:hypothetical protein